MARMPEEEIAVGEQFKKEGNQFFAAGDYVRAVAAYNKAIKADPENGVLYSNRAASFIHLQKEVKAIKDAEQAILLKPDWAKGYFRKGTALVALRKWDEAIEVLNKALEIEPKSKEISTLLREATRKRSAENGEKKREERKGLKLVSDGTVVGDTPKSTMIPAPASANAGAAAAEQVMEKFVQESLSSAITQFSQKGELKSIVYVQAAAEGEALQMIGIEAGFDSPEANNQCLEFLRGYVVEHKSLAVVILAEKRNIAFPQVWKGKAAGKWKWKEQEQGIFMQLEAAVGSGKENGMTERKVWFIPTGTAGGRPQEPVELDVDQLAIMPPLFR